MDRIKLKQVSWLDLERPTIRPEIPDACYAQRLTALRTAMEEARWDCAVLYADREHYANFRHIIGFEPRFEEGLAIIHRSPDTGDTVLLGNECYAMHKDARVPVNGLLCQVFSLPNQPMDQFTSMKTSLQEAGIRPGMKVGLAGWKLFTPKDHKGAEHLFCVPGFVVDSLREIVGFENLVNGTGMFIHSENGLRTFNNAHEIAYFEYGAALASDGIAKAWRAIKPGLREMEIAAQLEAYGQVLTCHSMVSSGENTGKGLISPGFRKVTLGDPIVFCMGLAGGLSCRGAYAVSKKEELSETAHTFEEALAKPYYRAVVDWYENIGIGVSGGGLFDIIQTRIPKEKFGWTLNPGHLISSEEWQSSNVYPGSAIQFKSGMLVQMDIIPAVKNFVSANAEDGICLADAALRDDLCKRYPDVWNRMQKRRDYMMNELGIALKEEILPMSNLAGRYSPYLLNHEIAFSAK